MNMYRQYDGYPEGHGAELVEFLKGGSLVNGLRFGEEGKFYNGMGCLAAQLVSSFKDGAGNIYLYSTNAKDCGQDFEYHISYDDGTLNIKVVNRGMNFFGMTQSDTNEVIFEGDLKSFESFCKPQSEFELNDESASGFIQLQRARVKWKLSINYMDIPEAVRAAGKRTYRSLTMDGKEIEFSDGFTDLHTTSYGEILAGRGYGLTDARHCIETVNVIRTAQVVKGDTNEVHPFVSRLS